MADKEQRQAADTGVTPKKQKPDPTSSAKTTPPPSPSTKTIEATQGTVTTRSTALTTRPTPTSQEQGAPSDADMADKGQRQAADTEVTPKKQRITKTNNTKGAHNWREATPTHRGRLANTPLLLPFSIDNSENAV